MKVCPNCGKANLPTRKFCIRCGAKLTVSKRRPRLAKPQVEVPETGRVVTGTAAAAQETEAEQGPKAVVVEEEWVRPSQVARDRVRRGTRKRVKSELEKAREAFKKAEEVGLEETGTGVVETRMLRASEVKELLEESAEPEEAQPARAPAAAAPAPSAEPTAPEAVEWREEKAEGELPPEESLEERPEESEVKILGAMSAIIHPEGPPVEPPPAPPPEASVPSEFRSSLYEKIEVDESEIPVMPSEGQPPEGTAAPQTEAAVPEAPPSAPATAGPPPVAEERAAVGEATPVTCPRCGATFVPDLFEYPTHVYSEMAEARLKRARFFVVQGKNGEAQKMLAIARAFYEAAGDSKGIEQVERLKDSILQKA